MNPFDALINGKSVEQRREWMEPVKRNGRDLATAVKARGAISVDEWLRTLPASESYRTPENLRFSTAANAARRA